MNKLDEYKFSKIGTNPMKYFNNFYLYFNRLPIGEIMKTDYENLKITHDNVEIFSLNSPATFRQNIDCWIWMGLIIKKKYNYKNNW